ncbi:hypothetical protein [Selenomonas infelix]|nr:hypothetical protein [Selenomonas infelix]
MTRVYNVRGILLIIAGVHAFITTHIYEKYSLSTCPSAVLSGHGRTNSI